MLPMGGLHCAELVKCDNAVVVAAIGDSEAKKTTAK